MDDYISNPLPLIRQCIAEGRYRMTLHVKEQGRKRKISDNEILQVLKAGKLNQEKTGLDLKTGQWKYRVQGRTVDGRALNVAVCFTEVNGLCLLILTAFEV